MLSDSVIVDQAIVKPSRRARPVDLNLAVGLCLLRKIALPNASKKELESALQLWAQESLPAPVDQYYLHSWQITADERGLAALPRKLLTDQREQLRRKNRKIAILRVPELRPPADSRPGIILWPLSSGVLACVWREGVLVDWQSFPHSLSSEHVIAQLGTCVQPDWFQIASDSRDGAAMITAQLEDDILRQAELRWPHALCQSMAHWNDTQREQWLGASPAFDHFLNEHKFRAASAGDKWRLALAVTGVLVALVLLITSDLQQREAELEVLRQHDAVASVRARRSELVASRSGQTLQQVYDLRALTIERHGVLDALREVADALPPTVRFEGFGIDRNGKIELEGSAETELDISTLLQRLGKSRVMVNPVLAFAQKGKPSADSATPALQFRIELSLQAPLLTLPDVANAGS